MMIVAGLIAAAWLPVIYKYVQFDRQCSRCEMSFMNPTYRLIHASDPYRVFEYVEGGEGSRSHNRKGHHVYLYIPGNAASFRQVRSIGAEILRRRPADCNVYSVDFGEELSAFDPAAVDRQIEYVKETIQRIKADRLDCKITIVGHSMGGVVGRAAGCPNDAVVQIVALASPSEPPIPAAASIRQFRSLPTCPRKTLQVCSGHNDVQAATSGSAAIRVDSIPLSWSDPHHQAIVWSNSLLRAIADHLVHGLPLGLPVLSAVKTEPVSPKSLFSDKCGDFGPFSGALLTGFKLARDFVVLAEPSSPHQVQIEIVPGKYPAASHGSTRSTQHQYLTLITGASFYIRKYCSERNDANTDTMRLGEYLMDSSPFAHMLDVDAGHLDPMKRFEAVSVRSFSRYMLPDATYHVPAHAACISSVKFPDGTVIYPDGYFLTGPFGKYWVSMCGDCTFTPSLSLPYTLIGWINRNKVAFQKGLLLGFNRKMPILWILLVMLAVACHPIPLLIGFGLTSVLYHKVLDIRPAQDPHYRKSDDLFLLKPLCAVMAIAALLLPYPIGCITSLPCLLYALFSKKKRTKAIQLGIVVLFELIAAVAAVANAFKTASLQSHGRFLYRLIPAAINVALGMHVTTVVYLPMACIFRSIAAPSAIVSIVCAFLARDHEDFQVKSLRKNMRKQ